MELKEYIQIIKKNIKLFASVSIIIFLAAFSYLFFRPISYTTSLILNVTRKGSQATDNYKYDNFYRLQADEKFSETLVEWIKSPRIEEEIFKEAGIDTADYSLKRLTKSIKAEKMSSQVVSVSFSAPDKKNSTDIAQAVSKIASQNTQGLDKDQKDSTWFEVISEKPVTKLDETNPFLILIVLAGAVFAAFFIVLIKHYFE
jgi:capsular polysaccharide biosynthesis protein